MSPLPKTQPEDSRRLCVRTYKPGYDYHMRIALLVVTLLALHAPAALAVWGGTGVPIKEPITTEKLLAWGKKVGRDYLHEPSPEVLVVGYLMKAELEAISLIRLQPTEKGAWFLRMKGQFRDDTPPSPPGLPPKPQHFNRAEFAIRQDGFGYRRYSEK